MLTWLLRVGLILAAFAAPAAWAQTAVLQGGSWTAGHAPAYNRSGGSQPVVIDSGPAGGNTTGQGLSELNITARGTGAAPYAGQGTGPNGEIVCLQDAVSTNTTGYHYLCLSANAQGGGLLSYGAVGAASTLPLSFIINGATYQFPFTNGYVVGPGSSTINHVACWNNTVGTLLKDCGAIPSTTPGGSSGQIQYNNAGAFGGFTMAGDCTLSQPTITCTKVNGVTLALGGTLTTAGAFTTTGSTFTTTLTLTGNTNVTLPTSGTLPTLAGNEALTNKTYNGNTWTAGTGTLTIAAAKTLTASNTITFTATDGSTLAIGGGGTLGTAAYSASSAYVPSGTQLTNSLTGDVNLNNASTYFDGPTVAQGATGTWCASGTVTILSGSSPLIAAKLWDGTTVIASTTFSMGASADGTFSLSGCLATPAGNLKISVKSSATDVVMKFNSSGNSKDSTLIAFRTQ